MQEFPSFFSYLSLLILIALSLGSSYLIASYLPWSKNFNQKLIYISFAFAFAPFLLGALTIAILVFARGKSSDFHLAFISFSLVVTYLATLIIRRRVTLNSVVTDHHQAVATFRGNVVNVLLATLALALIIALLSIAYIPLAQNDSLEYMLAAGELFRTNDIASYPLVSPSSVASGFYGPVTHPPLYVSLLYLFKSLNASSLHLPRFVSFYFYVSSILSTSILGFQFSPLLGLLSSLVYVSTPLAFLGGITSLIDPLFILSTCLIVLLLTSCNSRNSKAWIAYGSFLGISLWSHSSAILLFPIVGTALVALNGINRIRYSIFQLFKIFSVASLIIFPAYYRNFKQFGSFISDNPQVFALPALEWPLWFQFNRGLDNPLAIFQYGLLKGIFAPEAYGIVFYFLTISIFILIFRSPLVFLARLTKTGIYRLPARSKILVVPSVCVVTYFVLLITSVTLQSDIMIKNERYFLLILPPSVLLASYSLSILINNVRRSYRNPQTSRLFQFIIFFFASLFSFLYLSISLFVSSSLLLSYLASLFEDSTKTLRASSSYSRTKYVFTSFFKKPADFSQSPVRDLRLVKALNDLRLSPQSLVFSLRPSSLYYSHTKMISYLDPRLIPFYSAKSQHEALVILRNLGVTHVQLPQYYLPTFYNSHLQSIISNPSQALLLHDDSYNQIYELAKDSYPVRLGPKIHATGPYREWLTFKSVGLGGRKTLPPIFYWSLGKSSEPRLHHANPLFHRHIVSTAESSNLCKYLGPGNVNSLVTPNSSVSDSEDEYLVELTLSGRGNVKVTFAKSELLAPDLLMDIALSPQSRYGMTRTLQKRIRIPHSDYCKIYIAVNGSSDVSINSLTLTRISYL